MQLVDNDTFLKQLAALFESTKDSGSIWLTHKRLTHDGEDATMSIPEEDGKKEHPCLVRVTDGGDTGFSTKVEPGDLERFHAAYGSLLKASMSSNMRKRDKKRERQKAEETARRKRQLTEDIAITGAKRGNGRRKRQREIKKTLRLEQARKRVQERVEAKTKVKTA